MVRKLSIIAAMFLGLNLAGQAADKRVGTSSNTPFTRGTNLLSLKMGLGSDYYFNYGNRHQKYNDGRSPIMGVAYEHGITDLLGIGYLGLGGEAGFAHAKQYVNKYWASQGNIFHFGMTCNYHFDFHMITKEPVFEKIDLYAGLGLFIRHEIRRITEDTNANYDGEIDYSRTDPIVNGCIGGRYFFTDNISAMVQLGTSLAFAETGLTFKF